MKKGLIFFIAIAMGIILTNNSVKAGYMTKETVTKSSTSTVYSSPTGTNIFQCTYYVYSSSGTVKAKPQYYDGDAAMYRNDTYSGLSAEKGESDSKYTSYLSSRKIWRLKLSGLGKGNGWIQGR